MSYTDYEIHCDIDYDLNSDTVLESIVEMLYDRLTNQYGLVVNVGALVDDVIMVSILNDGCWLRYKLTNPTILEDEIVDMEYMEAKLHPSGHTEVSSTINIEWVCIS